MFMWFTIEDLSNVESETLILCAAGNDVRYIHANSCHSGTSSVADLHFLCSLCSTEVLLRSKEKVLLRVDSFHFLNTLSHSNTTVSH